MYNKLENNFHLSNKCALFYNMKRYYEAIGRNPFDVIPLTFHIRNNTDDPEFYKFTNFFKEIEQSQEGDTTLLNFSSPDKKDRVVNEESYIDEKKHIKKIKESRSTYHDDKLKGRKRTKKSIFTLSNGGNNT